jgi:hypothetical protein
MECNALEPLQTLDMTYIWRYRQCFSVVRMHAAVLSILSRRIPDVYTSVATVCNIKLSSYYVACAEPSRTCSTLNCMLAILNENNR